MTKKLPYGISNYEELITENYYYVDKTKYIEILENMSEKRVMILRPRKFGKTLFTSTLEYYYDIFTKEKFDKLFKNKYIGKNPTKLKNSYYILKFNFSGIDTSSLDTTINGFKSEVVSSIQLFIKKYKIAFNINYNDEAENILNNFFKVFYLQKLNEKIYVIIDEYDHFANEILGFNTKLFKEIIAKNGKVRKWYEVLKKGTETVVDRIFITGVAPITMDSTTSGFNIALDLTKELEFNDMLGFNENEVIQLMDNLEISKENQEKILPIIRENYDGYIFSDMILDNIEKFHIYNSNMTLYFLSKYLRYNQIPDNLLDSNIASDYGKIKSLIDLCDGKDKMLILEKIVAGEPIISELTEKFNVEIEFSDKELVSLLYYLGYLTINEKKYSRFKFVSPNDVIRKLYTEYYLAFINNKINRNEFDLDMEKINSEILENGRIDTIIKTLEEYLSNLSNRDYSRFSEKYVKVIFYTLARSLGTMIVKSELEIGGKYLDILLIPKDKQDTRYSILLEFKYIKKEDYDQDNNLLIQKQEEAKEQILEYKNTEDLKQILNLKCYTVVVIKDKVNVLEV